MFSENNRISSRQWHRLLQVILLAPAVVYLPAFVVNEGQGIGLLLAGITLSALYYCLLWMVRVKMGMSMQEYVRKQCGAFFGGMISLILILRISPVLVCYLRVLTDIIKERLIPDTNSVFIAAMILFVSCYFVLQGIEGRGRSAEILYWVVIIPVIIVIFGGLWRLNSENYLTYEGIGDAVIDRHFWYSLFKLVYLFCPAELILTAREEPENQIAAVCLTGAAAVLSFAACLGTFGYGGMQEESAPLVALTGFFNLFGSSIFRQDSIFLLFLLIGCLLGTSVLLAGLTEAASVFYGITKRQERNSLHRTIRRKWAFLFSIVLFACLYLFTDITWEKGSRHPDLEEKAYILALGIDRVDGKYQFTYKFSGKNVEEEEFSCLAEDGTDAEEQFAATSAKLLDFSHVQAVAVEEGCLETEGCFNEIMKYLSGSKVFSSDTLLVSAAPNAYDILTTDEGTESGIQLKELIAKELPDAESTVGRATNAWRNDKPVTDIVKVVVSPGGRIELVKK